MSTLSGYFISIFLLGILLVEGKHKNREDKKLNTRGSYTVGPLSTLTKDELQNAISVAEDQVEKLLTHESNLDAAAVQIIEGSPSYGQTIENAPISEAKQHAKYALVAVKASQYLSNKYCSLYNRDKNQECILELNALDLNGTSLGDAYRKLYLNNGNIPDENACKSADKYRLADGSCNHRSQVHLGRSCTSYRRLILSNYDDGLFAMRGSLYMGREVPSARLVTSAVVEDKKVEEKDVTLALPTWALFLAQDMSYTPSSTMIHLNNSLSCCTDDGKSLAPRYHHYLCAPITIPRNDPFYSKFDQTCMNYVRSLPAVRSDGKLGPAEQINQATHYIDGSPFYHNEEHLLQKGRTYEGGKLRANEDISKLCYPVGNSTICYSEEIPRTVFQPLLNLMHFIFVREHNRVASELLQINPQWNDEQLFQESRRIVTAEIQHVTYTQWLPEILGTKLTKDLSGLGTVFNESLDPSVSNVFATAAMPTFKSMIDGDVRLYSEDRKVEKMSTLMDHIAENDLRLKYRDHFIRALATQSSQKLDNKFSNKITNFWYIPHGTFGMDSLSLDIQRCRDHGLASYVAYRKYFNLPPAKSFKDLEKIMPKNAVERLKRVYKKMEDIDVFIGLILEANENDSLFGPLLQHILLEQFSRSRFGDRYFYDIDQKPNSFSYDQLKEIKKVTLARIFCDNSINVTSMQLNIFKKPNNSTNKLVPCFGNSIPSIDFKYWKVNRS